MQDQNMTAAAYRAVDLPGKKFYGQRKGLRLDGIAEIDNIRSVYDDLFNSVFPHVIPCRGDVQLADLFAPGVLRRSGIKHECVGAVGDGLFCRTEEHFLSAHADM